MAKVLARRDENWKKLQQYILDERGSRSVRGPPQVPVWGEQRDLQLVHQGRLSSSAVR